MTDLGPGSFRGPDPRPGESAGGVGRKKRKRPTEASEARKKEMREKKAQVCRLCGTSTNVNAHHLIPRGMGGTIGGTWTEANIVGLCGSGTTGCHGRVEARDKASLYLLRSTLTDQEYSYVVYKMGEGWLERRYPLRGID